MICRGMTSDGAGRSGERGGCVAGQPAVEQDQRDSLAQLAESEKVTATKSRQFGHNRDNGTAYLL